MDQNYRRREFANSGQYQQQQQYGQNYANHTPPAMATLLDSVPLGSDAENSKLLDLVDRLRECRVDQYIDLPQVVVVGDQSSGKSSVLEAITQIPFPRASIACTRYATQIRLRRDPSLPNTITTVSIIPYRSQDAKRFESFTHQVDEGADFTEIFQAATQLIFASDRGNFLSRDILSIERTGPTVPHMMTVVDLPGIIHNPTKTQTVQDVEAISALSKFYMSKDRTIILPIVGCDSEYARQIIVRRCKEADPTGRRTLGIITKPDMTLTPEREAEFIDLACNKDERNRLQLGWHVLRNRAHNEMNFTSEQRDEAERRYFAESKWGSRMEPSQLGVEALRKKLSTQLIRHIANEVFKVQGDIERNLQQCEDKLKDLGPGFETLDQMRQELQNLCKRSGSLTREATQGGGINPLGEDFFPRFNDRTKRFSRNLRSRVVISNENFSDSMEKAGALYAIEGGAKGDKQATPPSAKGTRPVSRRDYIEREVKPLIRDNPGQELSVDINPRLVYRLFQSYSANWPVLAEEHVKAVQKLCEEFLYEVMAYAWPQRMRTRVWRGFVQKAMDERFQAAIKELDELKKDRFRNVRSYHSSFEKNYYNLRSAAGQENAPALNKFEDTLNKMLLYYDHQLPTFISNVITQVIERHLIDSMEIIFEGDRVYRLKDVDVKSIMEEDNGTQSERKELKDQRDVLRNGLDICKEIASRPDLGPYEYQEPSFLDDNHDSLPLRAPTISRRDVGAGLSVYPDFNAGPSTSARSSVSGIGPARNSGGWGDQAEAAANLKTPVSAEEEDEDLKKALEESRKDAERRVPVMPPRPAPLPVDDDARSTNTQRRKIFGRY
jgi:GTPase SAR1 family protein